MSFYRIKKLGKKASSLSMTEPVRGALDVVLKQDSDNSPCCVYNETVALRLAQRLGVPLAMGVPSVGDGGMYFASLMVGGLSINLPNISAKKMVQVAERYPHDAAAIFVFDVWVLNDDRENNLKANLTSSPLHLVAAIDHEQTLLGRYGDMTESLQALEALEGPARHPLRDHLEQQHVEQWVARVQSMSDSDINDAVVVGYSVGGVHQRSQLRLAKVMKARRDSLPELVRQALS
ncbi:MAG: hypothetical protein N0E56_15880 [Candidatus Thiodiazotropha endolucinida]|nr:hypothetical protein [Candidatus Thiodiazotropha taylori]MCW4268103.1 hypothetical protein [Candidatus Thiodiazotropha endolucinida]